MPKEPKKNTTRKHKQSAKKGRAKQKEATGASASSDPSQWRDSRLKVSDTITRTDARNQYRLKKKDDLDGIPYETQSTIVQGFERTMYIYQERDIERRAWERHGGPERFDAYIAKLKVLHLKKNGPHIHFTQPRTYEDRGPRIDICRLPSPPPGPGDPYILSGSKTLWRLKEQMPPWFWAAYNEALWLIDIHGAWGTGDSAPLFICDKERKGPIKETLKMMMPTYPPRPPEPLAPSPSVDKVRAVLADAAKLPPDEQWGRDDIPGMTVTVEYDMYGAPESWEYEWSDEYLERLFSALIEVIDEHGTGPAGFEGIRWEVYEKCVECLRVGPHYNQKRRMWTVDRAAEWLDGQLASLEDSDTGTYRAKCSAGKRYNDLLPRIHPQGARSVGVRPR